MVTTLTSAIALSARSVLEQAGLDPADPANIATLTILVGAVMAVLGLLRLGSVMGFVSNAVMTGRPTRSARSSTGSRTSEAGTRQPRSSRPARS
ncbi:MAG TPA: SulP family inorganic anion transporter [Nakamurella sp.]